MDEYVVSPVGFVRSCFKEKFGVPRQPLLASLALGVLELVPPYNTGVAVRGLEQSSHIWLLFRFHRSSRVHPRLTVTPPRLGGVTPVVVFATPTTHRPKAIGQSVVKLERVEAARLHLSGIDLLDGTPIPDIKPYLPYADIVPDAVNAMAGAPPALITVGWSAEAKRDAHRHACRLNQPIVELIEQCLGQDPKPAYSTPQPDRKYGSHIWDLNVRWQYARHDLVRVVGVEAVVI